jgi:hypothetical protein
VRRLFPSFPSGARGLGLLALRLVSAFTLLDVGLRLLVAGAPGGGGHSIGPPLLGGALALCGAFLAAGFLTPIVVSLLSVLLIVAAIVIGAAMFDVWHALLSSWLVPTIEFVVVVSLGLLGPGRYSVDAHLFGRREIIIPPAPDSHK